MNMLSGQIVHPYIVMLHHPYCDIMRNMDGVARVSCQGKDKSLHGKCMKA